MLSSCVPDGILPVRLLLAMYGLQVLADDIQDDAGNVTRFVPRTDPAIQDEHRVRARQGGHVGAVQGAVGLRVPGHQPHQDREPATPPPPSHPVRRRRQRGHGQALRVHVLHRLPGVHGGGPRCRRYRSSPPSSACSAATPWT
ncbi:Os01g0528300 [Oryza sativa Japonica Group]|uniref:Os01g0528300 protein n=1 Tax=Oryza sativa subsp. japonica TaxID=39947 RepID=A0A0P0V3I2_ORYSJ|nr:hypothetical protein EE612_003154 [Oryza sativa]BAS72492.1 Os01g0528300 [Oryza sativa Japonica Group]